MFALISAILILLAAFGVDVGGVDIFLFGLALLALHFAFDLYPWRRR